MKNNSTNICFLTSVHSALDVRIFYKEAVSLVKAGYNVTLIAQHAKDEVAQGVSIIALPEPKNRFDRIIFLTEKAYSISLKQRADIYHFHDPELLPWMIFLKMRTGAKIIYDVHEDLAKDILNKEWIPFFCRKIISKIVNYLEKKLSKKCDFVIVVAPAIQDDFRAAGVANVIVAKNYPILSMFNSSTTNSQKNEKEFLLVYAGGLSKIRGIKEIIQAVGIANSNLKNIKVRLKLFGVFSDKTFEKEMKGLKECEFVDYMGWVAPEIIYEAEKKADIGIVCLHPVGQFPISLPIKLFEYMAASLPVIASNFDLWKEIIVGENCGLIVDPLNPKEIADAVIFFANNPGEAGKMGQSGSQAVLKKYNWGNEEQKLLNAYEKLCAE